ncbi:FUSC family protein [Legionella impletisoli]|nr:FUSC family protein [Legionella impletisoli]
MIKKLPTPLKKEGLYSGMIMSLSAVIAFSLYRYFQWSEGYWAVISIAAVTQAKVNNTNFKILLRLLGTVIGATSAYYFVRLLPESFLTPVFFICIFLAILLTLAATHYRYLMIITGLTFTLVVAAGLTHNVEQMALWRTYEVIVGCFICSLLSLLAGHYMPEIKGEPIKRQFEFVFKKSMLLEAFMMSLACGLTFLTWRWFNYPLGFWATISCLFVLEENIGKTVQNAWKRILAHLLVALFAGLVALFITSNNPWILVPLAIGLFACGYCLALQPRLANMANTMGIALSVVLLLDVPGLSQEVIVFARFFNVIYGVSIAFLIIYLVGLFQKSMNSKTKETQVK